MASPIYDFFVQNNLTQKSEEEFLTQYSDKENAETVYNFMKNNDLTGKDFNSFYNEYFNQSLGGASGSTLGGSGSTSVTSQLQESNLSEPFSPSQNNYMDYGRWLEASGITDIGQNGNGIDYDYRGFYEEFGAQDIKGHYTDKYKLPTHPTFSTGSKYSTEEQKGGKWSQDSETGKWTFEASDFNLNNLSAEQLKEYFRQNDPEANLILPDGTLAYEGELPTIAEVDVDVYATNPNQDRLQQNIQQSLQRELDLQSAQSVDPSNLTFGENLYNNLNNLAFGFYGTTDRAELFAANVANQLSKVADGKLTSWMFSPDELDSYIQKQLVTLDNYDSQLLPTNSDVLDDIAEGRYSEIPQGAVSAISGLVATIVPAYVSGGTLLATDMISNSTRDFNKTKAQRLGISENELYRSGQSDFVVPAMLGAVSFGLEKIGLRGLEKAMSQQFTSNILQSGARFLYNIGKEGAQEQLQYAVDRINTSLAEGKAPTTAVEEGLRDAYTTREGWNQAVMGAIASGTIGTLGALTNRIANQSLKTQAQQQVQEASNIQRELDRTDLNETSRNVLQQQMEQIRNNLGQTILQDIESVANLTSSQNRQVETLLSELETVQSTINDPSVADDAKQGLQQRSQELSNQIDAIINQESATENTNVRPLEDFSNPDTFYRVIVGDAAFQDIVDSGLIRTNADSRPTSSDTGGINISGRPTAFPSFSRGRVSTEYANNNPNNYIIETTDKSIQPSNRGRHGRGTTQFPTDSNGNPLRSLNASNTRVYRHIGNNQYELIYDRGQVINQEGVQQNETFTETEQTESVNALPREGIDFVFQLNPELADIGTQQQYNQYLDTIFPDTEIRDIVYHRSPNQFEEFQTNRTGENMGNISNIMGGGIFFNPSDNEGLAEFYGDNLYPTLINMNPDTGERGVVDYRINNARDTYILGTQRDINAFRSYVEQEQNRTVVSPDSQINPVINDTNPIAEVEVTQEEQVNVPITEDDRVSIINSLRDEEGRAARADAALNRIRGYIRDRTSGNFGITPEGGKQRAAKDIQFFKDIVEYASIKLLDGTIKTYEQFRTLVNLPNSKELREAFSFARAKVVNPQKYAIWETVDTFNKGFTQGVRQGVEQERERASNREKTREQIRKDREQRQADNLKASKQQLIDRLNRARREGTFRGFVRGSTVQSVIRDINNATTPRQVQRALTRLNSAIEDINYDRKVADITKKFRQLRRRSQSDNTPAGQVPIADQVSRIKPRDISPEYIDEVNQLLDQYIATRSNDLGQQLLDLVNSGRAGQSLASLKSQLLIAGAPQEEVDGVNSVTKGLEILDKYLPSIAEEQGEEGGKSPSRVRREAKVQALRNALATVDTEGLTPIRIRALNAFQEIDYESINDQQLRTLEEAMVDAFSNSTFYLAGDIITLNEEQQRFSDTAMLERIKNGTRTVSSTITNILKNLGNVRAQFEAIVNRSIDWPELAHISGFIDINQSTEVFHRRYQEIVGKPLEQLAKKYRDDLNDPVQSTLGAMYSDLAQYRSTWTQEEIQKEFDGRKKAIRESIDRMQDRTVNDSRFRSESKSLIENLNKAYGLVQSANTAEELYNLLNTGQRQLHNLKTTSFQTIFPDFVDNAMIFNNTLVDRDWVNYIPRSYRAMETIAERRTQAQAEMLEATENAAAFQGGVTTSETSGAANSRVLQGEELPTGKAIWFDSIDNFTAEFKKALYDIETQGARKYTSRVMRTGRVSEVIADRSAGDALLRGIATKVTNDKNLLFPRRELDIWRKISYNIEQLATRQALGGALQPLKQGAPAIIASMGRLGRNSYLIVNAVKEYTANPDQVLKLMQDSPISRRAIRKTIAPSQALSQRDVNQIKSQLRNTGGRLADRAINTIDTISLKPMELGDRMSARISFLAFYMDYFKRNGLKFNLAEESIKPNRFALEYANQQSDVALNISDPSLRPKWRLPVYISPFSSFSLNEKSNALLNTGKLLSSDSSSETRLNAAKNLGSHIATTVSYQGMSWAIRYGMIMGAVSTATYLLSKANLDDDDKKEAEEMLTELKNGMIDRNNSNSVEYALKDLVYGGIGGDLTEPLYTQLRNTVGSSMGWSEYTPYQGTETDRAFGALGGLGVPFQRAYTAYQNVDQFTKTDAEYRMERFGVENAQGTDFYVPVDYVNETIPDFSKQIYGASSIANIVGMTGASWQEVTALTSRLTRLAAQLEAKVASQTSDKSGSISTGKPRKTNQQDLQRLESLKRVDIEGERVELEEQEYDYLLKMRADFLAQNYDVIKPALGSAIGDEKSERKLSSIADNYAREMTIMNFNMITGQKALDRIQKQQKSADIWNKYYEEAHK